MRAGRIIAVVVGAILAVVGLGALAGGGALLVTHAVARDAAGYYQSPTERVDTATAALVARLDLGSDMAAELVPDRPIGTLRVRARGADGSALFVGVARTADVERWLAGAAYERVDNVRYGPFQTETHPVSGDQPVTAPAGQGFWEASVAGTGTQSLTWPTERGDWTVVLMNADARTGVAADASVGVKTGVLLPIGVTLAATGLLVLAVGVAVMLFALKGTAPAATLVEEPAAVPGSYPARLSGQLQTGLSRWLWLVKWVLVIPHLVVLALLWLAFVPLTLVAGVAILFTGRYPRAIFDFNVGVLRWTWRVSYYAYNALGTDRYPPFSLASDPTYPADFTVDYPDRLSRGLVLVKWWLLAIPHYIVVALFAGGWAGGLGWQADDWRVAAGGGLIGILVLVAGVVLLFSGRYPQPVFDFVMGMNRWCYQVLVYAALMRDEYPPFRLDSGGGDPGTPAAPPPPSEGGGGVLVGSTPGGTAG